MNSLISRLFGETRPAPAGDVPEAGDLETRAPSHQNAIDFIGGWNHAFPERFALKAGQAALYEDPRIQWGMDQFGSLAGRRVLELGPLEGFHTAMLERNDPTVLDAVEANVAAYLRCLVTKQVLDLRRAKFHLGSFVPWLERDDLRYDLIVASGVLYHMSDPIYLIDLIARRADAVFLWTHYFDATAMPADDPRGLAFVNRTRTVRCGEHTISLHARRYYGAESNLMFCGGPEDLHYWMEKDAIIAVLRAFGFDDIRTAHDQPDHPNGPAISIFARRKP